MFRNRTAQKNEPKITFGPHEVPLIPCHATLLLSELTTLYDNVTVALRDLQAAKTKVGHLRGKLSKENQQRSTASETSVFGVEAVSRLYAFAAARAEFELAILNVATARTTLGQFLSESLVQEPNPFSEAHDYLPPFENSRWMLNDILQDTPNAIVVVARHNVASAICLLNSLRENLPRYREYLIELPEFCNVLWNAYCAQDIRRRYKETWKVLVEGDPVS